MKNRKLVNLILVSFIAVSGCANNEGPNEQTGMLIGGVVGGLLGHEVGEGRGKTAATIIGTLVGASIGGSIGQSMDDTDRIKVAHSLETVRTGVPSTWRNPDTQRTYKVTPTRTRTLERSGEPCREYTLEALIGGRMEEVYGEACRQADGSWRIVR